MPTTLPFWKSDYVKEECEPVVLSFSRREVKRCLEALDWYIQSFAEEMIAKNLEDELRRYEDLVNRFFGVPDENVESSVLGRAEDLWEARQPQRIEILRKRDCPAPGAESQHGASQGNLGRGTH